MKCGQRRGRKGLVRGSLGALRVAVRCLRTLPGTILTINTAGEFLQVDGGPRLKYFAKGERPDRDLGNLFEPPPVTLDYSEWIARLTSHFPDQGCQLTHYMGACANAHRGKVAKDESAPHPGISPGNSTTEPEADTFASLCECGSTLKVISVIEARNQSDVVGKILKSIKFVFEIVQLPAHPPPMPVGSPEPDSGPADFYYM